MSLTSTKTRKAIGERLRLERERLGYQPLQIAQLLGVTLEQYLDYENAQTEPGLFCMTKLYSCGFDVMYIITDMRYRPVQEESELLRRFRDLSLRGRNSIFMTLDALEQLAPNLKQKLRTLHAK